MDPKLSITITFTIISIVFLILSFIFYRRDKALKQNSTQKIKGVVIGYSMTTGRPPILEYTVNQIKYEERLKYTYVSHISTPLSPVLSSSKDDLLDTKLRLRNNSIFSFNKLMKNEFPVGSTLNVYYNPDNPKQAFVERFTPSVFYIAFLIVGLVVLFLDVLFIWLM